MELDRLAERLRELIDERPRKCGDVLDPFAERRDRDREHVETIEQILTERSIRDRLFEVSGSWPR